MQDQLIIFDTTMRDGEQSPGASMTREEKVRIGKQLERLRVDVIEAGFAAASQGDFEAIRAVAEAVKESTVCSLARANENDIRRAGEAVAPAARKRIHTFIATSPIHMKLKLRMSEEQVLEAAVSRGEARARSTRTTSSSPPRTPCAPRSDFLCRVFEATIAAGATTINVPDTVGYSVPERWGALFRELLDAHPQRRQGGLVHALPQRPRHGRGQLAGGGDERRPAGGVHDQRPGRAGGQRLARGDRDGGADALGRVRLPHGHRRHADRPDEQAGVDHHRLPGPAQQGGGGRQRVRARVRHPPGRRAQAPRDLRDHACRGRGLGREPPDARQALRAQRLPQPPRRSSASRSRPRRRSTRRSPGSRSWPTRSARSSTRTSRRWSPTRA